MNKINKIISKTVPEKKKKFRILVIDRKTWLNGLTHIKCTKDGMIERSVLRNKAGRMCCLGFDCLRRGFVPEEILDVTSPSRLVGSVPYVDLDETCGLLGGLITSYPGAMGNNSTVARELMSLNDRTTGTLKEKEAGIKEKFLEIDIKVRFINDYPRRVYRTIASEEKKNAKINKV